MYDALFEELKSVRNSKGTYEVGLADAIGFVKDKGGNVAYEEGQTILSYLCQALQLIALNYSPILTGSTSRYRVFWSSLLPFS